MIYQQMHGLDNAISLIFLLNSPLTEGETKNAPPPSKDIRDNSDTNVAVNVTTSHLFLHILHLFLANLGVSAHILDIVQPNSTIRHSAQLNGDSASISSHKRWYSLLCKQIRQAFIQFRHRAPLGSMLGSYQGISAPK